MPPEQGAVWYLNQVDVGQLRLGHVGGGDLQRVLVHVHTQYVRSAQQGGADAQHLNAFTENWFTFGCNSIPSGTASVK